MKKILLIVSAMLLCVPTLWADVSSATTLKAFLDDIQKGQTKTFSGEVVCSFNDEGSYLYLQDETAGMRISAYGLQIKTGDKIKDVEIAASLYPFTGPKILSINSYTLVEQNVTITPSTVALADLDDYNYMLVRVEGLSFSNAGYNFELDTNGSPLKETVTQDRMQGYVCPFAGNIIGTPIPNSANVTGIANVDQVLKPRTLSDIEVVTSGEEQDENFARFLDKMTHYGSEVFPGELVVSYAKREGSVVTLVVQDDSAGVYSYMNGTGLKVGDKIKNALITMVSANGRYTVSDYTLVSEGNTITPKVITAYDMGDTSPYRYMMVKVENVGIKSSESGIFTLKGTYPILTNGANVESALLSTAFCPELVGNVIPKQADLTGILFFGFEVRPVSPEGIEAKGDEMSTPVIADCATVADVRKTDNDVIRLAGPVDVTYVIDQGNGFGSLFMQDATGGLEVQMSGIVPEDLKRGSQMTDVSLNIVNEALTLSRIQDKTAEITAQDVSVTPKVILPGSINKSNIDELQYTIVEYAGVRFVGNEPEFSDSYTYTVVDGDVQAMIYPYSGLKGVAVPEGIVNVRGLAMYNADLGAYIVRPRDAEDIVATDPTQPYIFLSTKNLNINANLGQEATASVEVTTRNCTAPVTVKRAESSETQLITPDVTSFEPSDVAKKVTFSFRPEEVAVISETFEFASEGAASVSLTVVASGIDDIQIVSADAEGAYRVFTTTGVKVLDTRDGSKLSTLPAGLYIVNGRKMIIR